MTVGETEGREVGGLLTLIRKFGRATSEVARKKLTCLLGFNLEPYKPLIGKTKISDLNVMSAIRISGAT